MDFATPLKLFSRLPAVIAGFFFLLTMLPVQAEQSDAENDDLPEVRVSTTEGAFNLRLRPDIAPKTVENFLEYVDDGFYDGTIFHRVIPGFMVQGGGLDRDMNKKPTREPVVNESRQTAKNLRGSVAMARTSDPDSATAQFFVNLVDNPHLDATQARPGYTVFGSVTEGIGVIDAIASVDTTRRNGMPDVPAEPVIIESVRRINNGQ